MAAVGVTTEYPKPLTSRAGKFLRGRRGIHRPPRRVAVHFRHGMCELRDNVFPRHQRGRLVVGVEDADSIEQLSQFFPGNRWGFREVFILAFLNVKTRRVVLSPATFHPNEAWVVHQAEAFVKQARADGLRVRYVQRDRDGKFAAGFDAIVRQARIEPVPSPARAPNTQAFVERFIGSIRRECLNHFVFFGAKHLDAVARAWLEHYHAERPHQGRENELLVRPPGTKNPAGPNAATFSLRDVRCRKRLGGLLKHYERVAA